MPAQVHVYILNDAIGKRYKGKILANNQLDALFHVFIYSSSLHVSSITVLIIRRSNCINTSSGMISLFKRLFGMPVPPSRHTKKSLTQTK